MLKTQRTTRNTNSKKLNNAMAELNIHLSLPITLNNDCLNSPIKRHRLGWTVDYVPLSDAFMASSSIMKASPQGGILQVRTSLEDL